MKRKWDGFHPQPKPCAKTEKNQTGDPTKNWIKNRVEHPRSRKQQHI